MEKKLYEALKASRNKAAAINTKVVTGQTTTFAERNYMKIIMKNEEKRKKEKLSYIS